MLSFFGISHFPVSIPIHIRSTQQTRTFTQRNDSTHQLTWLKYHPNIRIYDNKHCTTTLIVKKCRKHSREPSFFSRNSVLKKDELVRPLYSNIFISPIYIHSSILAFPNIGQDLFTFIETTPMFWTKSQNMEQTCQVVQHLLTKLEMFHTTYKMALNDIKPENITVRRQDMACFFIDLELLCKGPQDSTYYSFSTAGYISFHKLLTIEHRSNTYDVYKNDKYALGVTIYNMITEYVSPSKDVSVFRIYDSTTKQQKFSLRKWVSVHNDAISYVETVLLEHNWCNRKIQYISNLLFSLFIPI